MSVHYKEEWPLNLLQFGVIEEPLSDRQDVPLIECAVESRSAVTRRTEDDALPGVARIGLQRVVSRDEFRDINQDRGIRRFAGGGFNFHFSPFFTLRLNHKIVHGPHQKSRDPATALR